MRKILVIIDAQNDFIKGMNIDRMEKIHQLLDICIFDNVIATKYVNSPSSNIMKMMNWDGVMSSPGSDLVNGLDYKINSVFNKTTFSSVRGNFLELLGDTDAVFICGFDTECCVLATATDLFENGIRPLILKNYCGASEGISYHEAGLKSMEHLVGDLYIVEGDITSKEQLENLLIERKVKF